jgi:hypothetical protein
MDLKSFLTLSTEEWTAYVMSFPFVLFLFQRKVLNLNFFRTWESSLYSLFAFKYSSALDGVTTPSITTPNITTPSITTVIATVIIFDTQY